MLGLRNQVYFISNLVPEFLKISVTFFSNTTALIGIAIMLNVVCIGMARERKYSSPPKFLKNFFSGFGGRLLCLGNYTHQVGAKSFSGTTKMMSIGLEKDNFSGDL